MPAFSKIDQVVPTSKFGNGGAAGWGFSAWSEHSDEQAPHRGLLESLAEAHPEMSLDLPDARANEDFVEGSISLGVHEVSVYFETTLSYLSLWSPDRKSVDIARSLIVRAASSI